MKLGETFRIGSLAMTVICLSQAVSLSSGSTASPTSSANQL
jgi:hypothetical protein